MYEFAKFGLTISAEWYYTEWRHKAMCHLWNEQFKNGILKAKIESKFLTLRKK